MPPEQHDDKINPAVIAIIVVVLGMIAAGPIYYLTQLDEKIGLEMDYERAMKLQTTTHSIENYFSINATLPVSLDQLSVYLLPDAKDPETQNFFEYKKLDELTYELCAEFSTNSDDKKPNDRYTNYTGIEYTNGHYCFNKEIPEHFAKRYNVTKTTSAFEYEEVSIIPLAKDEQTVSFQRNGFCENFLGLSNTSLIPNQWEKLNIDSAAGPRCELKGINYKPDSSSYRPYSCANYKEGSTPKSATTIAFKCKATTQ